MAEQQSPIMHNETYHPQEDKPTSKIVLVLLLVLLVSIGICFLANQSITDRNEDFLDNQQKRLALLSDGRAEAMETWLKHLSKEGDRLIKSDLFRLYASEVEVFKDDLSSIFSMSSFENGELTEDKAELAAQLPMMQNMLREFTTYTGFVTARILSTDGQAYIATDGYLPPLDEAQMVLASETVTNKNAQYSPLRKTPQGLEMDVFVPMFADSGASKVVGLLMMTQQVTGKITELLSNSALSAEGERTCLVQKKGEGYLNVLPWTSEGFAEVPNSVKFENSGLAFGERDGLDNYKRKVYSLGVKVDSLDWWIVQQNDYEISRKSIDAFSRSVYIVSVFAILIVILMAGLVWWVLASVNSKRMAKKFECLASQIDCQKRFIDSINAAVDEFITLKDISGKYTYVNDAFAEATGRSKEDLIGMDDAAIFGFDTAKRLTAPDKAVCEADRKITFTESVFLRSKRYQFHIAKSPYRNAAGACLGVVSVFRDITDFVAVQENNKRLVQRAIMVLANTIEAADPHLGGHTKLVSGISVAIGRIMNLSETDLLQLETAANLSQIGKVFVPKEILIKPGKLTEEEKLIMEQHVEHAYKILKDIDIAEDVVQAIYQMNEHLDGNGYPKKLKGAEIVVLARILAVANVFCAMIRPRVYRAAKTTEQALDILVSDTSKFDHDVVEVLRKVVSTSEIEKLLAG
ncbi:HD domain-containing phosphohydrolase [Maridesulfovibrio ferrireducens]|uniref:HD domain-containing phosphohydrolase n=1 Tax=Maridesulfovibrio ferrireducens TaxID=246191 RepID=UPI0026F31D1F|nr:HD domain-containing phosphohydrolase [Maridesulfovibrio ferrireducens]